ncbi:MAG TPA: M23 family metallopeptidase [Caldisericia bacterium]|nr:M23 family metallopeptidase [Caldisericia bacterium]HXK51515.1 M23 family metallopeptidase [Caldisericia bacterium]
MSLANPKNTKPGTILIVSSHNPRSFKISLTKPFRIIAISGLALLVGFFSWIGYKYWYYQTNVTSFYQRFQIIMDADDKDLSREIKVKKTLIKTEAFINISDTFLSKASSTEQDACNSLELPYSNKEFSDFLYTVRHSQAKAQPASTIADSYPTIEDHSDQLETSQLRQEAIQDSLRITPTGLPINGYPTRSGKYISTPGVEILAPYGTYIKATAGGEVTKVEEVTPSTYVIEITHKSEDLHTTLSRYIFCYDLQINVGDSVEKGQVIAKVGLHPSAQESFMGYQLLVNNLAVEP